MHTSNTRAPRAPLLAIIGATGTGKSQLAIDLALRFNGEVVNGDAMQLYAGLPVITNQIAVPARKGVPHHLLGCVQRADEAWSVETFVLRARRVIDEIRARGRLPILVGGTHYYTQALLFRDALVKAGDQVGISTVEAEAKWPILKRPTEEIWAKLFEVDPVMANRWHPNDRRKISRSLEIWLSTGRKASDIYGEQQRQREGGDCSREDMGIESMQDSGLDAETRSGLRFDTLVLWTHSEKNVLRERLHARIESMVSDGLVDEAQGLFNFLKSEAAKGNTVDQTRGIWVSIGYKEFAAYLEAREDDSVDAEKLNALLEEAIERTDIHTRQYANYQIKWIRNKFLQAFREVESAENAFVLDTSDPSNWKISVLEPAANTVQHFIDGNPLPDPLQMSQMAREMLSLNRDFDISHRPDLWIRQTCDVCGIIAVSSVDWEKHLKSRGHKKLIKAQQKGKSSHANAQTIRNSEND